MKKKNKKPWPTKDAMNQIYDLNLWGKGKTSFYSGVGSHQPKIVQPYLETVISFLTSFKKPLVVCDFGCGDFNIGKELVKYTQKYIAIDIVESLIEFNKKTFKKDNLEFKTLDVSIDDLPSADCVLIRQVLQHLSNKEVQNIVAKLSKFKYVILTEHLPLKDFIPNKDIISGQGIRLKKHSGINLLKPPFEFKVVKEKQLLSIILDDKSCIKTTLFKVF